MKKKDHEINCHGYTYKKMDVIKKERFIRMPTLATILRWFRIVKRSSEADVVSWVSPSWEKTASHDLFVAHTAVRDKRGRLWNRVGAGERVERTSYRKLGALYEPENYRKVLLARKGRRTREK